MKNGTHQNSKLSVHSNEVESCAQLLNYLSLTASLPFPFVLNASFNIQLRYTAHNHERVYLRILDHVQI